MNHVALAGAVVLVAAACSAASSPSGGGGTGAASGAGAGDGGVEGAAATGGGSGADAAGGGPADGGFIMDAPVNSDAALPGTCEHAEQTRSYVGCSFWPTVTTNGVWSDFDFAAIVANVGGSEATVTVERNGVVIETATVPANGLSKIALPWVPELKWEDGTHCATTSTALGSVVARGGAYHLTSTVPVTVYQFNALQYEGKSSDPDFAACPGFLPCATNQDQPIGCFSFSNDASLLLPDTAWTGTYRVTALRDTGSASFLAITAAEDGTNVQVKLSKTASTVAGGPIGDLPPNGLVDIELDAGDVVQLIGQRSSDFSGSLVQASAPVQVVSGQRCINVPAGQPACDHVEETVFPAEALGAHYIVAPPSTASGGVVGHLVRLYGNVDGTSLSYPAGAPPGAPTSLLAGEVVELENVTQAFEIVATREFAVSSTMLAGTVQDPPTSAGDVEHVGDPSQSVVVPVEQFQREYVFLAPDDYDVNFVDVTVPLGAKVHLDGKPLAVTPTPVGSNWGIVRVKLGEGVQGAHLLASDVPVGIQVMGFGTFTSYQYPGGSGLEHIAPPPVK